MKEIIKNMIEDASIHHDYELAEHVYKLLSEFAITFNCPSNWRDLGEQFAEEYAGNDWTMENCKLWDFEQMATKTEREGENHVEV